MIILKAPSDVAFNLFNVPIYYYGICFAIAALSSFALSFFITKKYYKHLNPDDLYDIFSVVIVAGLVCARLYYCALNYTYYSLSPIEILDFRQGGLSIHGGILGGLIFGSLYVKLKKLPVLQFADIIAYGLVLAQSIGRWGNFFNCEAYGLPAKHFIVQFIPQNLRISGYEAFKYFHPTFLYESIFDFFILLILFFVLRNFKYKFDGFIFVSYLILYSIVRFFIEGIRLDSVVNVGILHSPQIASIVIIILSTIFMVYKFNQNKKDVG